MREIMRTTGKGALVALILWFALAAGSVWANTQVEQGEVGVGEGVPTADAHVATEMHGEEDAGHAIVDEHTNEVAVVHGQAEGTHGEAAAGGHGEKVDSLSPAKVKDFGFRVMNFIVLMIILVKFGAKPIAKALGDRRKQVRIELEDLEAKKVAAEKAYKEFSAKLESVEKDVSTIVEKAVAQAEIEKVRILEAAEKSADDVKRSAEMAIANEVTAAKRSLKVEVTEQAAVLAEELIIKNLTAVDQVKIIEDYLDKVGAVQ